MTAAMACSPSASTARACWCRHRLWPPVRRQRLRIAASDVSLTREAPHASSILNVFPARIKSYAPLGQGEVTLVLALGVGGSGTAILARITRRSWDVLGLRDGLDVFAQVKGVSLVAACQPPFGRLPGGHRPARAGTGAWTGKRRGMTLAA